MNDRGEVVGGAATPDDEAFEAYLWSRGILTDLETVDGCGSAQSINSKSQIVGNSFLCTGEGTQHAVLWEHGAVATDLNTRHSARLGPDADERVVDQRRRARSPGRPLSPMARSMRTC